MTCPSINPQDKETHLEIDRPKNHHEGNPSMTPTDHPLTEDRAAGVGKVLDDGKRDLMRAGWVAAWMTIREDPDRIHDNAYLAFNAMFAAKMEGASND